MSRAFRGPWAGGGNLGINGGNVPNSRSVKKEFVCLVRRGLPGPTAILSVRIMRAESDHDEGNRIGE
jgi:hypothetical protein